jgi:poly-beta-hydroxyalkanoate depolymerase
MFTYPVITNFDQAEEYRENLDFAGEEYLQKIDKLIATDFPEGQPINLDKIIKPSNLERFWLAFTYILLAIGKDISISEDQLTVKILESKPDRQLFATT